jgi:hypothetical protein
MAFTVKSWQPSTNNSNSLKKKKIDYILQGFSSSEAFKIPKYPAADNFGNITTGML